MVIKNNSDIDVEQLSDKTKHVIAGRTGKLAPVVAQTAFPLQDAEAAPMLAAPTTGIDTSAVEAAAKAGSLKQRWTLMSQPGLSMRQRIRLIPVIGYLLAMIIALIKLPRTTTTMALRLDALQNETTQLNERLALAETRLAFWDSLKLGQRMERVDALDIGARLMQLDKLQISRKLNAMNQLMRLHQEDDVKRQARDAAMLNRMQQLEQSLRKTGSLPAQISPAVAQAEVLADNDAGQDRHRFYVEFEALFRGSREDIRQRLQVYLPYLTHITDLPFEQRLPVIDVGCGRGEWLGLLDEQQIPAIGIDMNAAMVDACLEQGFVARYADAIAYLRELPAASVGAVTGFHIIEHLPFEKLLALFDAAFHALCPGGVIIFETPNPENLLVGACNFYFDPTHLNPIVPQVAEFMAKQRGFSHAEILRLHPYPDNHLLHGGSEVEALLNKVLYGPQDYAVIGRK